MAAIDTTSASRRATLTRLALTAVLGFPIGFVGLLYGASGPVGLPFAAPALYLIYVFVADLVAVAHGAYRPRRAYKWFLLGGTLIVLMWVGYRVRSSLRRKDSTEAETSIQGGPEGAVPTGTRVNAEWLSYATIPAAARVVQALSGW